MPKIGSAISSGFKAVREGVIKPFKKEVADTTGTVLKTFEIGGSLSSNSAPQQNSSNPLPNPPHQSVQKSPQELEQLKTVHLRIKRMQDDYNRLQQLNQINLQQTQKEEQQQIKKKNIVQFEKREEQKKSVSMSPGSISRNPEIGKKKS